MGERIKAYFADGIGRITAFVPDLLAAVVILLFGYLISRVLAALTRRALDAIHFDRFLERRVHPRVAEGGSPTNALASIVFWVGMLITLAQACRPLALVSLGAGIDRLLAFLPHLLVAAIILMLGAVVANVVARLLRDSGRTTVATFGRVAVLVLSAFMALDQVGVARDVVMTAFGALLGAAAVAAAIAFGVGNRQLAGELMRRWIDQLREEPPHEELPLSH
jgi:hypothetical protein